MLVVFQVSVIEDIHLEVFNLRLVIVLDGGDTSGRSPEDGDINCSGLVFSADVFPLAGEDCQCGQCRGEEIRDFHL